MKKIPFKGGCTVVSDEDFIYLVKFKWCLNNGGYVQSRVNGKSQFMHRVIAARARINCSKEINHVDGNRLNNQRENLRAATRGQNSANSKGYSKSGLKGAYRNGLKWQSQIKIDGQPIHLGTFDSKEKAHEAYCLAAEYYHGEYARF